MYIPQLQYFLFLFRAFVGLPIFLQALMLNLVMLALLTGFSLYDMPLSMQSSICSFLFMSQK